MEEHVDKRKTKVDRVGKAPTTVLWRRNDVLQTAMSALQKRDRSQRQLQH